MFINNLNLWLFKKSKYPCWIDMRLKAGCPNVLDDLILNISDITSISNCIRYHLKYTSQKEFQISRLYLHYNVKERHINNILNFINKNEVCSEKDWNYGINNVGIPPTSYSNLEKFHVEFSNFYYWNYAITSQEISKLYK